MLLHCKTTEEKSKLIQEFETHRMEEIVEDPVWRGILNSEG